MSAKITSKRRIARLMAAIHRSLQAGLDDPMTQYYHAQEFVADSSACAVRRLAARTPYSRDELEKIVSDYFYIAREKRNAHRDPARLRWLDSRARAEMRGITDVPF